MFTFFSITLGVIIGMIMLVILLKFTAPQVVHRIEASLPKPLKTLVGTPPGEKVLLVMGVDDARIAGAKDPFEGARTDVMMLVRVSSSHQTVSVVSIPRDSKVFIADGHGVNKINAAHAFGGAPLAVKTVEDSFGIPVDNFILLDYQGVHEIVDALGGIDVYVEKPMHYVDHTAKLNVSFEPGYHHLDGVQAEEFLRFRHDELGDIGRIRRQQEFISAVAHKMKDPWLLARLPFVVQTAAKYVRTDLSFNEMAGLAAFARDVDLSKVQTATLPGYPANDPNISYWIIDPDRAQEVLDRLILLNDDHQQIASSSANAPIKVGIYYDPHMREDVPKLVDALQAHNFQVVCKSPRTRMSTQIIAHSERTGSDLTDRLRAVDTRLSGARLIYAPVGTTFESNACSGSEDYTVVLGSELVPAPVAANAQQ